MPYFFTPFRSARYSIHKNGIDASPIDITRSFILKQILTDRMTIYYNYSIQEGDRPDIIADKYYDDSTLDWVILMSNKLINPLFDWPLDYRNFVNYLIAKYGDMPTAIGGVHHYNKILSAQSISFDGVIVPKRTVQIDLTSYNALSAADRETITFLAYEQSVNDDKRDIVIVDRSQISRILSDVSGVFA